MSSAPPEPGRSETTELILAFDPENPESLDRILPVIYGELRQMAHRHLAKSGASTLRTTALVHEAYLKLVDDTRVSSKGRAYFFGAAARAMRQVLVDRARRRNAKKRGGGAIPLNIDDVQLGKDDFASELLDLDEALTRLTAVSERQGRVVECRFYGGMSIAETAVALGISERTVKSDWAVARAWLFRELSKST